jgi:hypothetical protein
MKLEVRVPLASPSVSIVQAKKLNFYCFTTVYILMSA